MTNLHFHRRLAAAVVVTVFAAGVAAPVHSAEANRRSSIASAGQVQKARVAAGTRTKRSGLTKLSDSKATTSQAPAKVAAKANVQAKAKAKATKRVTAKQFAGRILTTAFASFLTVSLVGLTAKMGGIAEGIFNLALESSQPAALVALSAGFAVLAVMVGQITWYLGDSTVGLAKDLFASRIGSDKADDAPGDSDASAPAIP
ncbi:MAG: hypothetical protein IPL79_00125 [Myxococcales bacterium]|nr:hypothetical protein [Myxococcales bacterium]